MLKLIWSLLWKRDSESVACVVLALCPYMHSWDIRSIAAFMLGHADDREFQAGKTIACHTCGDAPLERERGRCVSCGSYAPGVAEDPYS